MRKRILKLVMLGAVSLSFYFGSTTPMIETFLPTVQAYAANSTGTVTITSGSLNIRKAASTDSEILGSLEKGSQVSILATEGEWYQIQSGDTKGYVMSTYITVENKESSSNKENDVVYTYVRIKANDTKVYTKASAKSEQTASVQKGEEYKIKSTEDSWVKIKLDSSTTGYIKKSNVKFLEEASSSKHSSKYKTATVTANSLNVRSEASNEGTVIASVKRGEQYSVNTVTTRWVGITLSNKTTGYVAKTYVKLSKDTTAKKETPTKETPATEAPATETPTKDTEPSTDVPSPTDTLVFKDVTKKIATVNVSVLNVRENPNTTSTVLGKLTLNTVVEVKRTSSTWINITYNGKSAYVSADYVTVTKGSIPTVDTPADNITDGETPADNTANGETPIDNTTNVETPIDNTTNGGLPIEGGDSAPIIDGGNGDGITTSGMKDSDIVPPTEISGLAVSLFAQQFVGCPYVWGGTSLTQGADCSGFVQSVYKYFGISLKRTSAQQRTEGREVSFDEARPGDLICYDGHVAIFISHSEGIVHASNSTKGIIITKNPKYKTILSVRRIIEWL